MQIANIFMREVFRFNGIPKVVISDMNIKFTSEFWKELFTNLDT